MCEFQNAKNSLNKNLTLIYLMNSFFQQKSLKLNKMKKSNKRRRTNKELSHPHVFHPCHVIIILLNSNPTHFSVLNSMQKNHPLFHTYDYEWRPTVTMKQPTTTKSTRYIIKILSSHLSIVLLLHIF